MSKINPGDIVTIKTDPPFSDEDGNPGDPDIVKLIVRRPYEPPVEYTYGVGDVIEKDGVGTYHADYPVTRVGRHYYRWQGSGGLTAAEENYFDSESKF